MKRAAVVIALLVIGFQVLVNSEPTQVGCGGGEYNSATDPNFDANLNTILEAMVVSTANAQDKDFTMHLPGPDVYGHSTCLLQTTTQQCVACLTISKNDMRNICGNTREGSANRPNCGMQYGTSPV